GRRLLAAHAQHDSGRGSRLCRTHPRPPRPYAASLGDLSGPLLPGEAVVHTVILGNGIVAASIAFRLTKRLAAGDRITVIGKKARPGSATLAAAAMLNSFAEIEKGSLDSEIDRYRFGL